MRTQYLLFHKVHMSGTALNVCFRMLIDTSTVINMNCVDPLGRTALLMAIDNENMEMLELLLENKAETKDALLHAINEEYVEAVEVLLDHEESIHIEGEPWSWETLSEAVIFSLPYFFYVVTLFQVIEA